MIRDLSWGILGGLEAFLASGSMAFPTGFNHDQTDQALVLAEHFACPVKLRVHFGVQGRFRSEARSHLLEPSS